MLTKTIEELLVWAFVHELPKGGGVEGLDNRESAWGAMNSGSEMMVRFAALGMRPQVSISNFEPRGMWFDQGEAHPDARAIGAAVAAMGRDMTIRLPKGWNPLGDWPQDHGLVEEAAAKQAARLGARSAADNGQMLVALVIGTAVLGRRPIWTNEPAELLLIERKGKPAWFAKQVITDAVGKGYEIEVDGWDRKKRRPSAGAYLKHRLSTDPAGDILARLDWQLWVAALRHLEGVVGSRLVAHKLFLLDEKMTPWMPFEGQGPAVICRTSSGEPGLCENPLQTVHPARPAAISNAR